MRFIGSQCIHYTPSRKENVRYRGPCSGQHGGVALSALKGIERESSEGIRWGFLTSSCRNRRLSVWLERRHLWQRCVAWSHLRSLGSFVEFQRMRLRWSQRFTKLRDDDSEKNSREQFQSNFRRRMFQWLFCPVFRLPPSSPIYIASTFLLFNGSLWSSSLRIYV